MEAVAEILERIGIPEDTLVCGAHPPWHGDAALELARRGEEPRAIHNNCSGKHANMLALCRLYGWDPEGYYKKSILSKSASWGRSGPSLASPKSNWPWGPTAAACRSLASPAADGLGLRAPCRPAGSAAAKRARR